MPRERAGDCTRATAYSGVFEVNRVGGWTRNRMAGSVKSVAGRRGRNGESCLE